MTHLELCRRLAAIRDTLTHGCSDGNCVIKRKTGMHTNGGCRCLRRLADDMLDCAAALEPVERICGRRYDLDAVTDEPSAPRRAPNPSDQRAGASPTSNTRTTE